ncbi:MAG TPA: aldolase/citrate lyase family protein [Thermoplasmata archaeon]|nr:aldolase/citrate lyase family protein [Thermoplasmata archaeon]
MKRPLVQRLREGGPASFGTWVSTSSPVCLDALDGLGFDWFMIDTEHAHVNPETLAQLVALQRPRTGAALVRVGEVDQYLVKTALDTGAEGVLVPLVNTEAEARRAVSYAKYPPDGVRGIASAASTQFGKDLAGYLRRANSETLVGVQIETREALANVDAIAAVAGVDVLFVGPQDLTLNLGLVDNRKDPLVRDALRRVAESAARHGKAAGTLVVDAEEKKTAVDLGYRFIGLASDVRFLLNGARALLAA